MEKCVWCEDVCVAVCMCCMLLFDMAIIPLVNVLLSTINNLPQEEEDIYSKIYELCDAVIHLESSHTRVAVQTPSDKEMVQLLSRYCPHEGASRPS